MTRTTHTPEQDAERARRYRMGAEQAEWNARQATERADGLLHAADRSEQPAPYVEALRRVSYLQESIADRWREAAHTLTEYALDLEAHARGER